MVENQTIEGLKPGANISLITDSGVHRTRVLSVGPAHPSRGYDTEVSGLLPCGKYIEILATGSELNISIHGLQ